MKIFLYSAGLFFHYSIIHFSFSLFSGLIHYNYMNTINNKYQSEGSSMRRKELKSIQIGESRRQLKCSNDAEILFMESPFETQEQRDDHVHSGETSHEKMMQPRQKQNSGPLPKTALGD